MKRSRLSPLRLSSLVLSSVLLSILSQDGDSLHRRRLLLSSAVVWFLSLCWLLSLSLGGYLSFGVSVDSFSCFSLSTATSLSVLLFDYEESHNHILFISHLKYHRNSSSQSHSLHLTVLSFSPFKILPNLILSFSP